MKYSVSYGDPSDVPAAANAEWQIYVGGYGEPEASFGPGRERGAVILQREVRYRGKTVLIERFEFLPSEVVERMLPDLAEARKG